MASNLLWFTESWESFLRPRSLWFSPSGSFDDCIDFFKSYISYFSREQSPSRNFLWFVGRESERISCLQFLVRSWTLDAEMFVFNGWKTIDSFHRSLCQAFLTKLYLKIDASDLDSGGDRLKWWHSGWRTFMEQGSLIWLFEGFDSSKERIVFELSCSEVGLLKFLKIIKKN